MKSWNSSDILLKVYAALCMAVCGGLALRSLAGTLGGFLGLGRMSFLSAVGLIFTFAGGVLMALTAVFCALTAFKRTDRNSDGLLVCLAACGLGVLAAKLMRMIVYIVQYPYMASDALGRLVLSTAGIAAVLGGIYLIERFVMGGAPLMGKSLDDLKLDVREAFDSVQQAAGEAAQSAQNARAQYAARQQYQPTEPNQANPGGTAYQPYQPYQSGPGQMPPPPRAPYPPIPLKTDRSLIMYILLSVCTCSLYSLYFIHRLARDVNTACAGDGRNTAGLLPLLLLSVLTCGIYPYIWYYNLGNRLAANAPRYGLAFQENGTTVLLWELFGVLLCGVGPFVALNIIIKNTNAICAAYNYQNRI